MVDEGRIFGRSTGHTYEDVRAAIENLRTSNHESWEIDDKTAEAAVNFTRVLEMADAKVPQIFPHSGDALVFTWRENSKVAYITVTKDNVRQALIQE